MRNLYKSLSAKLDGHSVELIGKTNETAEGRGFAVGGSRFVHHSDIPHQNSAVKTFTGSQKLLGLIFLVVLLGLLFLNWQLTLKVAIVAVTFIYFADLLFNLFLVYRSFGKPPEIFISDHKALAIPEVELPTYTVFCPLYKEGRVLPQFVEAIEALEYPKNKLQVLLLLEEDDKETVRIAQSMGLPKHYQIVVVPHSLPKTKPKAMNYGLLHTTGEYVVVYDAEDKPEPLQLRRAVAAFRQSSEKIICIQAKLNFYNPNQNLLTRLFTAEYSLWFDLVLPGLQSIQAPIPLGGTSNHFKTKHIKEVGGWDAFNVTEDCDLGMRLAKHGYQTAIVDSTTYEEANSNLYNWYRQRSRWIKGYMQTYLVQMRHPKKLLNSWKRPNFVFLQLVVGGKVVSMFINPFLWMVTIVYFAFRGTVAPYIEPYFPNYVLYLGVTSLVFGNFLYLYYYMIGLAKRQSYSTIKVAFVVPLYWLAMSVAAWKALYELITRPHYWQKTVHGLHLGGTPKDPGAEEGEPPSFRPEPVLEAEETETPEAVPAVPAMETRSAVFSSLKLKLSSVNGDMSSGAWLIAAVLAANVLNFLFNALLGRIISLEDFGLVTLFNTILSLFAVVLSALGSTVNYETGFLVGKDSRDKAEIFVRKLAAHVLKLGLYISIGWLLLIPFFGPFFQVNQWNLLVMFTPVTALAMVAAVYSGYLRGTFLFTFYGRIIVLEALSKLVCAVMLVLFGLHTYVALAIPISVTISLFLGWRYARRNFSTTVPVQMEEISRESFPTRFFSASIVTAASSALFLNVDVLLAKHYLNPENAGAYALLSLVGKMVFFFGSLLTIFIVSITSRHEGKGTDSRRAFARLLMGTFGLAGIGFIFAGIFGSYTVPILFGDKAQSVVAHLIPYTGAMALFTISNAMVSYHVARKRYALSWVALSSGVAACIGIAFYHESVASIANVVFLASLFNFVMVAAWHAVTRNSWFVLRNITDLLDAFVPLSSGPAVTGKRILIFNWRDTKHAFAGGAETYIHELSKRWIQQGHSVTQFCGNDSKSSREEVVDGVRVIRRGGFYMVYAWAFVYYILQFRGRYDVIIDCQNGVPFFTPFYAKEQVYCLLHHVHQDVFHKYLSKSLAAFASFLEGKLMPLIYRNTKFITVSESSKKEMLELGLGKAGIEVVFPGVDLATLEPGEKYESPMVLYLGRLKAYKSVDVLIRAFKNILVKVPGARLVIAGGGEELQNLQTITKDLELENVIDFRGKVSDEEKISLLQKAWVFVNPSMMEGWGITTIEANACGVPVVASNVPGLRDSVKNPHTGFLVPHGSEEALANRVVELLEDKDKNAVMSREARVWAENFDWDKSAQQTLDLLSEAPAQQHAHANS